jgi:glycosyltransferase involved in cell wall biosynthesis
MNILFISNLSGNLFAGPNNSVPAQVHSQKAIDNVLWYNINNVKRDAWDLIGCKNLTDFSPASLDSLPDPFNRPDIAVVEELYCYPFSKIIADLIKYKIPYIIVPRSELTQQAQKKKSLKKKIANAVFFNRMIRNAVSIQYLTTAEMRDSGNKWNKNSFIIPNGIDIPEVQHESFNKNRIVASYIGRFEIYQKGLDILLNAIAIVKVELRKANFILNMYGVDQNNTVEELRKLINANNIQDLVYINDAVYGAEKEKVLLNSDVFLMSSRFEGMPMGMIEALAYGVPCIATEGTNLVDDVRDFRAGWVSQNNQQDLAKALNKCVLDQGYYEEISKRAISLAKKYSWEQIALDTHDILSRLISK